MKPLYLRLAGLMLSRYVRDEIDHPCSDWYWPVWFPVYERGVFVHALYTWNGSDDQEIEEFVSRAMSSPFGPPGFLVAAYCAYLLRTAGGGGE